MTSPLGIYEEEYPNNLHPLSLLSPIFDLRFGFRTILSKLRNFFGDPRYFLVPERFKPLIEKRFGKDVFKVEERILLINSSLRPSKYSVVAEIKEGQAVFQGGSFVACRGKIRGDLSRRSMKAQGFEILEGRGLLIEGPWELIEGLKEGLRGTGIIYGRNVKIEEPVYLDLTEGPILIADEVRIEAFTRISGPAYIGRRSAIHSARINPYTFIGDVCRVGGEVEFSIIEPYVNKAHFGYVGHSYISSFTNLGAGTTTSDLKNTYGTVRVKHLGRRVDTGLVKLGSFISHHVKTSINSSIYSGKKIGAMSHVHGLVNEDVPPFMIYGKNVGLGVKELLLESAIKTAERMKKRRGLELSREEEYLIRISFEISKAERNSYIESS